MGVKRKTLRVRNKGEVLQFPKDQQNQAYLFLWGKRRLVKKKKKKKSYQQCLCGNNTLVSFQEGEKSFRERQSSVGRWSSRIETTPQNVISHPSPPPSFLYKVPSHFQQFLWSFCWSFPPSFCPLTFHPCQ